ncbi:hypothetical protein SNEBB_000147 [Seison nebaliae]|nr:hypothetical protein SNEBB_000147 [Seison nebaliae]
MDKNNEDTFVGIGNLPTQVHRKFVKKGFEFCLMVSGESGLGKSTLLKSLFLTNVYEEKSEKNGNVPDSSDWMMGRDEDKTVRIERRNIEIEERGVKVRLTIVDTPGFGDFIDNSKCYHTIVDYINEQFQQYLCDESGLHRRNITDRRVHCLLHFISPSSRGLKPIDIAFLKSVHDKVNIVPIIAKSDTLKSDEKNRLKKSILNDISAHGIGIYTVPICDSEEDMELQKQNASLQTAIPFAVVGSNQIFEVNNVKVRARRYPWGLVEIDNVAHCDFSLLRTMIITHMQDLQEVTHEIHYENYRSDKLSGKLENISKCDMSEKDRELKEKEAELLAMKAKLASMEAKMSQLQTEDYNKPQSVIYQ